MPALRGESLPNRKPLFWHFPGYLGSGKDVWRTTPAGSVRDGDWKLIEFFETGKVELYDLKNDIGEKTDLAAKEPARRDNLHAKLKDWRTAVGAKMPAKR
jgi:arylsulfatase A-like enzyme